MEVFMKIAIPVASGKLCLHFGHCEIFKFFEVDKQNKKIINETEDIPPVHEPGVLPAWIKDKKTNIILAGGMGQRAQSLFLQNGIEVIVGVEELDPKTAVLSYLDNNLKVGSNNCDH
jgi:ATP-binding protein involved in chromosome partitioning